MDNLRHKQESKGVCAIFSKLGSGFRRKIKTPVDGKRNETSAVTEIIAKTPKIKENENNGSKQGGTASTKQQASTNIFDETAAIPNIPDSNEIENDSKALGGLNKGKEVENPTQDTVVMKNQEIRNDISAVMGTTTAIPCPTQDNEDETKTEETHNKESERSGSTQEQMPSNNQPKQTRRQLLEDDLKAAAESLNLAINQVSRSAPCSDPLTLQFISQLNDVEGKSREIEEIIDKFIEERRLRVTRKSQKVWKDFLERWYLALFPYIKGVLNTANVWPL